MFTPYGLAFAGNNGLLVSDQSFNRVLLFPFTNGTFTAADNGAAATKVFGQPGFTSSTARTSDTGMSAPHHLSSNTVGRPYVTDSGNNRVLIFDAILNIIGSPNIGGFHASFSLPAGGVEGIFVNSNTGEIWVTDTGGSVRKYPRYDQLIFNSGAIVTMPSNSPVAVTQDQYGDLIVAEAFNRVTFYHSRCPPSTRPASRSTNPWRPTSSPPFFRPGSNSARIRRTRSTAPLPCLCPRNWRM